MGKGRVVVRGFGRGNDEEEKRRRAQEKERILKEEKDRILKEGKEEKVTQEDKEKERKRLKEKADELLRDAGEKDREEKEKEEKKRKMAARRKLAEEKRKAEEEKRKEKDKVAGVKNYLVSILKESGLYHKNLGYQIEAASSTIVLFRVIRDFILKNDMDPTVVEKSREGDVRVKENPAYRIYAVFDSLLRKDLRALMMNLERVKGDEAGEGGDDELTELIENLRDD